LQFVSVYNQFKLQYTFTYARHKNNNGNKSTTSHIFKWFNYKLSYNVFAFSIHKTFVITQSCKVLLYLYTVLSFILHITQANWISWLLTLTFLELSLAAIVFNSFNWTFKLLTKLILSGGNPVWDTDQSTLLLLGHLCSKNWNISKFRKTKKNTEVNFDRYF
jgi:hypothetical protein